MTSQEEKTDFVTAPPIQKEVDNSASNLYLLRHPREDNNTNRQRINAKLLKIGVLGVNNVGNKSEDQVMDALLKAKVVRLDNKMIPEIDGLELVDKVERIYLQGNYIQKIENLDFHMNLTWLNLSDNYIRKIENLNHLRNLKVLDLSLNNISVENADYSNLPTKKLMILNLYGNPCSSLENNTSYRANVRKYFPKLLSLDGSRMDIDVSTLIGDVGGEEEEEEEEEEEDEEDALFQCDGTKCGRCIIYGTRFQVVLLNDGKEKTLDLCVGCAYERAILNQGNKNTEQIKIVQKGSSRKIANSSTNTSNNSSSSTTTSETIINRTNFNQTVLKLNIQQQTARTNFQTKREEIMKRSNQRLQKLQLQQQEIINKKNETEHDDHEVEDDGKKISEGKFEEKDNNNNQQQQQTKKK